MKRRALTRSGVIFHAVHGKIEVAPQQAGHEAGNWYWANSIRRPNSLSRASTRSTSKPMLRLGWSGSLKM